MSIIKKKKKKEVVKEIEVNETPVETVDEEIQTTFNDDQEGILEDATIISSLEEVQTLEEETEDC